MAEAEKKSAYHKYMTSPEWHNLKVDLLKERGSRCEKCGGFRRPTVLHIHHLTYERLFKEEPEDLMILCPVCHMKEHGLYKEKKHTRRVKKKKRNNALRVERKFVRGGYKSYDGYLQALKAAKIKDKFK